MPDFSTFFRVNTVSTALLFEIIVARKLPVSKVVLASSQAVVRRRDLLLRRARHLLPGGADRGGPGSRRLGDPLLRMRGHRHSAPDRRVGGQSPHCVRDLEILPRDDRPEPRPQVRHPGRKHALLHRPGTAQLLLQRLFRHRPHLHPASAQRPAGRSVTRTAGSCATTCTSATPPGPTCSHTRTDAPISSASTSPVSAPTPWRRWRSS